MHDANLLTHSGSSAEGKVRPVPQVKPKLLDRFRKPSTVQDYSRRTEQSYPMGVKRFILFHRVRDPAEPEINPFLTHLTLHVKVTSKRNLSSGLLFIHHNGFGVRAATLSRPYSKKAETAFCCNETQRNQGGVQSWACSGTVRVYG
jgi:hypothetical protein